LPSQHFVDASPLVDESTAEWILEHPGGGKPAMPDFGTVKFWGCAFADQTERDLSGDSTKMIMHKGYGTATTSNVSGDAFSVTWRAGT
jgi:Peptidase A4 family